MSQEHTTSDIDISEEFMKLKQEFSTGNDVIEEAEDSHLYSAKTKKKKKKKRKYDSYDADKLSILLDPGGLGEDDDDFTTEDFLIAKKVKKGKRKDLFDTKSAKKKAKQDIEKRFNPELANLNKLLKDNEDVAKLIRSVIDEIQNTHARGAGKLLTDLVLALNSTNSNRSSVIREIANIKKATIDLSMKAKKNSNEDKARNEEEEGINIFNALYSGGGRKALLDQLGGVPQGGSTQINQQALYDSLTGADATDILDSMIDENLENGDTSFRSNAGTAYVKYENMKPEYVLFLDNDGSYELEAIDKDGSIMPDDYPRIDIDNLGKISINMDNMVATDETGRTYRIIQR